MIKYNSLQHDLPYHQDHYLGNQLFLASIDDVCIHMSLSSDGMHCNHHCSYTLPLTIEPDHLLGILKWHPLSICSSTCIAINWVHNINHPSLDIQLNSLYSVWIFFNRIRSPKSFVAANMMTYDLPLSCLLTITPPFSFRNNLVC
jgi:hypothetical protein